MHGDRPFRVRFDPVAAFSFEGLTPWATQCLALPCTVISDGLIGFEVVRQYKMGHQAVLAGKGKAGCEQGPFQWLNTVLGNLKTRFLGTHHAFNFAKYAHRYLALVQYRFNRRYDLAGMVKQCVHAALAAKPCPKRVIQITPEERT